MMSRGMQQTHKTLSLQLHTITQAMGRSLSSLQACFALSGSNKEPSNLTHEWNSICFSQLSVASAQFHGHTFSFFLHWCRSSLKPLRAVVFTFLMLVVSVSDLLFFISQNKCLGLIMALTSYWQLLQCQHSEPLEGERTGLTGQHAAWTGSKWPTLGVPLLSAYYTG